MKHTISSLLTVLCFGAACASNPAIRSGIDVRLNAGADPAAPRPEGVLRVTGIHNGVSEYVPVASLDPSQDTQRVALPPGSYTVQYSPVVLEGSLGTLRNRAAAKILSPNPFVIDIADGQFLPIDVRAVTGVPTGTPGPPGRSLATR